MTEVEQATAAGEAKVDAQEDVTNGANGHGDEGANGNSTGAKSQPSETPAQEGADTVRASVEQEDRRPKRRQHETRGRNIKSNFDNLPESSDPDEIRRQVEFYFSDANLPMDEYLLRSTGGPDNKPFPLKEIHTFKRMKHFQPYSALVDAIKQSATLELDDKECITRKTPLSSDFTRDDPQKNRSIYEDLSSARSVYAKGFGRETSGTQTEVEEFFAPYGDIVAVRLRRLPNKDFKGSATVEFVDEDTAKAFLALETKPKWKGDKELQILAKKDWLEEKKKEDEGRPQRRQRSRSPRRGGRGGRGGGGRGGGRGGKGGRGGRGRGRGGRDSGRQRDTAGDDGENKAKPAADVAQPDAGDEIESLNKGDKKRSREDEDAGQAQKAEPEAKKTKVDDE